MRKILSLIITFALLLSFTACEGNFEQVELNDSIAIPENGVIQKSVIDKIKNDNAIATFTGVSGDLEYEWIIFGSDIEKTRDVNLSVDLTKTENALGVKFHEKQDLGFPALLSVHLNEKWGDTGATAYYGEDAVYSVSITGSKTSILNVSVNKIVPECNIVKIDGDEDASTQETEPILNNNDDTSETQKNEKDDYLSGIKDSDGNVYIEDTITTKPNKPSGSTQITDRDDYLSNVDEADDKIYSDGKDKAENGNGSDSAKPSGDKDDNYLSGVQSSDDRLYSDGKDKEQDKYKTDPVPEGKPMPVEPENQEIDKKKTYTCTFSIECSTILNNLTELDPDKRELIPVDGVILAPTEVTFYDGESVFDVLQRVCKENGIHLESSWTPIYNSAYIEGIHNLYEFDCGQLSGWMYRVDGWYPNYGCSRYQLADGEKVEFRYTCDLGKDVGCEWMAGS